MPSRMDRYYKSNNETVNRSRKNEDLYKRIYDEGKYSNIEGIAMLSRNNEVNITKIQDMIKNRENYRNQKKYEDLLSKEDEVILEPKIEEYEEKNYDIREILNKAKSEYNEKQNYHRLKEAELPNPNRIKKLEEVEEIDEEDKLKGLIDTITNTSMLNKMGDSELSLDVLDDLKSNNTTIVNEYVPKNDIDTSFYTSGMKFKSKDFEELEEMNSNIEKNNKLIKVLITIISIILILGIGFLIYNFVIK